MGVQEASDTGFETAGKPCSKRSSKKDWECWVCMHSNRRTRDDCQRCGKGRPCGHQEQEGADTEDTPDDDPPTDPVPEAGGASETEAAEAGADQAEASPPARKKRRRKRKKKKKSSNALLILLLMAFLAACVGLGALLYSQGVLG